MQGVDVYLQKRVDSYRQLGFHWWRDSAKFVEHFAKHGGGVCVQCRKMRCEDVESGELVRELPDKVF